MSPQWTTIGTLVSTAARRYGDREFLRFATESVSFAEAERTANRLARLLIARGLRPGDRAAIMLDNEAAWPLCWFAIMKAGGVAVPVNAGYREADLAHVLRDSGAVLVLTSEQYAELVRTVAVDVDVLIVSDVDGLLDFPVADPGVVVAGSDLANLQYTSGTTGFPKACMLTHDYWLRTAWLMWQQAELRGDDVFLIAQAFSYMDPQWAAVLCLFGGIPLVVLPRFSASGFWRSVREHGATVTYVLGTMPLLMFKQPESPADHDNPMRLVLCSGIRPELHERFERRWGTRWRELYGSTESGLDLIAPPDAGETVGTGALGDPPPGKEVIVAGGLREVGEILVRGQPMMRGYWNHPDTTEHVFRGGWYHTGDLGYVDERGWIHHAGRLKDVIRRGGENVSAAEVESVLEEHPAVLSAAVVAIPDELFGELVGAFIQPRAGYFSDTSTARDILAHIRRRLAKFKVPAYLTFVTEFPLTPSARVQKSKLLDKDLLVGVFDTATESWTEAR